jgi:hypothetical protein
MLVIVLGTSIIGAQANTVRTAALTQNVEAQTVGGIGCGAA